MIISQYGCRSHLIYSVGVSHDGRVFACKLLQLADAPKTNEGTFKVCMAGTTENNLHDLLYV